jgi:ABC-type Na+ transport system ATPase subunit NatA
VRVRDARKIPYTYDLGACWEHEITLEKTFERDPGGTTLSASSSRATHRLSTGPRTSRKSPGDVTLWPSLSGGEIIDLLARLHGGTDGKRKDALLERFDLDPTRKGRAYSKGNRQKVALIAALASGAELLVLDESTAGLDPLMEAAFREAVEDLRHSGTTVLLSSHIPSEVEALCDRVTIIRAGLAGLRRRNLT